MTKRRLIIRFIILVIVTIIFISTFYFFFKNSRASSPRNNKQYMEQLTAASKRYNTTGRDIAEINPNSIHEEPPAKKLSFFEQILQLFSFSSK